MEIKGKLRSYRGHKPMLTKERTSSVTVVRRAWSCEFPLPHRKCGPRPPPGGAAVTPTLMQLSSVSVWNTMWSGAFSAPVQIVEFVFFLHICNFFSRVSFIFLSSFSNQLQTASGASGEKVHSDLTSIQENNWRKEQLTDFGWMREPVCTGCHCCPSSQSVTL